MKNKNNSRHDKLLGLIPHGEGAAIPAECLRALLGLPDTRDVRRAVESARYDGYVICSSRDGYFQPETERELLAFIHQWTKHARSVDNMLHSAREMLYQVRAGQIRGI